MISFFTSATGSICSRVRSADAPLCANYFLPSLLAFMLGWISPSAFAIDLFGDSDLPEFELAFNPDVKLRSELRDELESIRKSDIRYNNMRDVRKIAGYELKLIKTFMASKGYYASEVEFSVVKEKIRYQIEVNEQYTIADIVFDLPKEIDLLAVKKLLRQDHQIEIGQPLIAENVLDAKSAIFKRIAREHCFYKIDVNYKVHLATETKNARIRFWMKNSPQVKYGDISFTGLKTYKAEYFRKELNLEEGGCFKRAQIDSAKLALLQTNLLVGADINIAEPKNGSVDVTFDVLERDRKTIKFGIGYDADDGFGISTGWEHRNFTGRADKLNLDLYLAERRQTFGTNWLLPDKVVKSKFRRYWFEVNNQETDAFDEASGIFGAENSQKFKDDYRFSYGLDYEYLDLDTDEETSAFNLVSATVGLDIDKRNNILNPTRGWLVSTSLRPSIDIRKDDVKFLKMNIALAGYHEFSRAKYSPVLALRAATGSIANANLEDVPISKRFFSGGGGSVRGYAYQSLSDFENDDPIGGLSYTEVAAELRILVSEKIGLATFMDGGYAYSRPWPNADQDLLWGAGIGLRYYTSFAPIRFDVAVPLDKREDIDDDFQIYLSIGQSF